VPHCHDGIVGQAEKKKERFWTGLPKEGDLEKALNHSRVGGRSAGGANAKEPGTRLGGERSDGRPDKGNLPLIDNPLGVLIRNTAWGTCQLLYFFF
jgi:hypothetical protein